MRPINHIAIYSFNKKVAKFHTKQYYNLQWFSDVSGPTAESWCSVHVSEDGRNEPSYLIFLWELCVKRFLYSNTSISYIQVPYITLKSIRKCLPRCSPLLVHRVQTQLICRYSQDPKLLYCT